MAEEVFASAVAAYGDTVERRPRYASWLREHPQFGAAAGLWHGGRMTTDGSPGVSYGQPAGRWVLFATVLGSGLTFIDATVVNIALPAHRRATSTPTSPACSGRSTATPLTLAAADPARRLARRPVRPPAGLRDRGGVVRRRLAAVRRWRRTSRR